MTNIKKVIAKENHRLEILLDNNNSVTMDFTDRLETVRFGKLSDEIYFHEVYTDGNYVKWGNEIEISVNEVLQMIQK